jgi:F-type H+-transporting ATPase subunit alpha
LGDRFIGKTSIYLTLVLLHNIFNYINSNDGLGCKRLFAIYIGINQNLSKFNKLLNYMVKSYCFNAMLSNSSSNNILSFLICFLGIKLAEKISLHGVSCTLCFDDLSQHAKVFRSISLLANKIPSRDCYSSDVFNIHSTLLERCCSNR